MCKPKAFLAHPPLFPSTTHLFLLSLTTTTTGFFRAAGCLLGLGLPGRLLRLLHILRSHY